MNEIPITLTALTISRSKLLEHLHRLATGFAKCGEPRLSNEMLTLMDGITRGEFDYLTGNNQQDVDHEHE